MGGRTERALVEEEPVATADFVERAFEPERALTPLDVDESHDRRAAPLPARRLVVVVLLVVDVVALVVDDVLPEVLGLLLCVLPPLLRRRARTGRRPRPLPPRQPGRLPRGVPRRVHAAPGRTLVGGVVILTTWRNPMIIPPHRQRGGCAYPTATPSPRHFPPPIRKFLSLSLAVATVKNVN